MLVAIKEHEPLNLTKSQVKHLNSTKDDKDYDPELIATKSYAAVPIAEWLKSLQALGELREKLKKAGRDARKPREFG